MKILLVTMEWPPFKGGVANYYCNLAQELAKNGVDICVLTTKQNEVFTLSETPNLKVYTEPFLFRLLWPSWLKLYFKIKNIVKKEHPDIIWVGQVLPVGEAAYLASKQFNIPYFVSAHGMDILLPQKNAKQDKILRKILANSALITANSEFTKHELKNLEVSEEKIAVIHPCPHITPTENLSSQKPLNDFKEKYKLQNKKVLLTVGRLVKRKGHHLVIKAMPALLQSFPNLVYLIAGSGQEKSSLMSLAEKLQLSDKVVLLSDLGDEKLKLCYQSADIFVMPNIDLPGDIEGFGLVYLEAALFGLPSIAGKSGGVGEAVIDTQTGLLANSNDGSDLLAKITELLTNEELRKKLGKNGQARTAQEFIWAKQALRLKECLLKLTP